VLQFCPQAPVKSIEIALALSTLATVSLTEESFTRIRELAKWRSPEDRPSCFDPFQELPRLDIVLAFRRHEIQQRHGGADIVPWLDGAARGTGAKPFVVPTDWQAKAVAIKSLALRSPSMIAALLKSLARILQVTLPNTTNDPCARARVQAWQAHRSGDFGCVQTQFGERQESRRRGGHALRVVTVIPAKTCCAKTMIGKKARRFRSRPMRGGGEFGPG
jgi:hypothetical protein